MAIDMERAEELVAGFAGKEASVTELLLDIQDEFNYVPEKVLEMVSEKLHVPLEHLLGVVTFYNAFTTAPKGRNHIKVCTGTACVVRGSRAILETVISELGIGPGEVTEDGAFSIESVHCFGTCAHGPVVVTAKDFYGYVTQAKATDIIAAIKKADEEAGE